MLSPYSVRLLVKDKNESGKVAGVLYFVSTLGSALGTIITSFYFVLMFDINTIIISFSCTLVLLGMTAILLNKFSNPSKVYQNPQVGDQAHG